ncbi:MAG: B12-binding domain-containing protein, partial [Chloroflexi bacterium]|nr:B12-binding domain-containing protein [Chloroflexota bacterium]
MKAYLYNFLAALRAADRVRANRLIGDALAEAIAPEQLLDQVVIASLNALGEGWEDGSVSLTQVYMGGRIVEEVIESLLPRFGKHPQTWGKIVIGTLGDHHGLGQRIVGSYLASAGAEVVSLGLGVKPAVFVERAIAEDADLVAISVLMYHSALEV